MFPWRSSSRVRGASTPLHGIDSNKLAAYPVSDALSSAAAVSRFGARYRFARACEIQVTGYSLNTGAGYAGILKVALAYTAFEALLKAVGKRKDYVPTISARHDHQATLALLRERTQLAPFFRLIRRELDKKSAKDQVAEFLAGRPCCALVLAESIRHIFFHGTLTPNAHGSRASEVATACNDLSQHVLQRCDAEFNTAVDQLHADATAVFC